MKLNRIVLLIRSALFNAAFFTWTAFVAIAFLPSLLLPRQFSVRGQRLWAKGLVWLLWKTVGIEMEVRGHQYIAREPVLVAAKHQSAWDTFIYLTVLTDPAMVMKRELFWIPLYGWYARKWRMIGVDRNGGVRALKTMVAKALAQISEGRSVVIFPEGTRSAVGARLPYQPGVAALARALSVPVVPVAVNSGAFWPRRGFIKRPGTIVIEFLPPIDSSVPRKDFMRTLEMDIEGAVEKLVQVQLGV